MAIEKLQRSIEFHFTGTGDQDDKIKKYFDRPGFKLMSESETMLVFNNKSFFFNTWTFNPLDWESDVVITRSGKNIKANFSLGLAGQLITKEEIEVWESFVQYLQLFLNEDFDYEEDLQTKIKAAKTSGWKLLGMIMIVGLLLIPLGVLLNKEFGLSYFIYFLIPILGGYFYNYQRSAKILKRD